MWEQSGFQHSNRHLDCSHVESDMTYNTVPHSHFGEFCSVCQSVIKLRSATSISQGINLNPHFLSRSWFSLFLADLNARLARAVVRYEASVSA